MSLRLSTPEGAPYRYEVTLPEREGAGQVSVRPVEGDAGQERRYAVRRDDHASYLDLYDRLADDFGLRRPLNRRTLPPPTFQTDYRALLTENLDPGILYGYGDPAVLRVADAGPARYYMVCTSNDAPDSFPLLRSDDLQNWEHVGYVFPEGQKPTWTLDGAGVADYWAPELHRVGGEYRVYFVARHRDTRELCIGMARAAAPEGPFTGSDAPLLRGDKIDPHVFVEEDGRAYLYWKEDNNGIWPVLLAQLLHHRPALIDRLFTPESDRRTASFAATLWPRIETSAPMDQFFLLQNLIEAVTATFSGFEHRLADLLAAERDAETINRVQAVLAYMKTPILACALSDDGTRLDGDPVKVLENDRPWEAHVVEGIWVFKHGGRYFMFYAANDFSTADYGISVAVADSPRGPFAKSPEPFLRSTPEWIGPGHPSVAPGPDGEPLLFLHAFRPGEAGYKRFRAFLALPLSSTSPSGFVL